MTQDLVSIRIYDHTTHSEKWVPAEMIDLYLTFIVVKYNNMLETISNGDWALIW